MRCVKSQKFLRHATISSYLWHGMDEYGICVFYFLIHLSLSSHRLKYLFIFSLCHSLSLPSQSFILKISRRQPPQPCSPTSTSLAIDLPRQVSHFFSLSLSLSISSISSLLKISRRLTSSSTFKSLNRVVGVRFGMGSDVWVLGH